ncbi:MAG: helix-turn-helix transcriptional regulator [Bacteriovorax sp.]|nr:helix-turn-helix transcriptional regulator [Bacteriovorax sp.]
MRIFNNIATLVKTKRIEHPECYSQIELANLLGFKCNKLIANIEEAECNVPLKIMTKLSQVLNIPPDDFKAAVMKDHEESLDLFFKKTFKEKIIYM